MDLSLLYFPSAVTIGALHALEPGHAKTLTAAYLIGTRGTKVDATILGLSVAVTHSLVVVGLSVAAVLLGRETLAGEAEGYLAIGSSVLVIALGFWLFLSRFRALRRARAAAAHGHNTHTHEADPVILRGKLFNGSLRIAQTESGERFMLQLEDECPAMAFSVQIFRNGRMTENYPLISDPIIPNTYQSLEAPSEPHEFSADIIASSSENQEKISFAMHEPENHEHDHALLSDEEHARAHAADLPEYVHRGERPSLWQLVSFGAVGGVVPCPAAVSVMLLSLSLNSTGKGLILVLGFSLGLAITLVGVGLIIVTGVSKLAASGRMSRLTMYAPSLAAVMVILSGSVGLLAAMLRY